MKDGLLYLDGVLKWITAIITWVLTGKVENKGKALKCFRVYLTFNILVMGVQVVIKGINYLAHPRQLLRTWKLEDDEF